MYFNRLEVKNAATHAIRVIQQKRSEIAHDTAKDLVKKSTNSFFRKLFRLRVKSYNTAYLEAWKYHDLTSFQHLEERMARELIRKTVYLTALRIDIDKQYIQFLTRWILQYRQDTATTQGDNNA